MLRRLEEESVVPVVGQNLLTVNDGARETLLYPLLAKRLAESLDVSPADLPRGAELEEVARRYRKNRHDVQEIYRNLRMVFRELDPFPIPAPLAQLAKIRELKLYVTTTFDFSMERAVDHERFGGQRQTLAFAYAPNDKQDLPPEFERLNRPAVFYLMGRLSGTPHSYALTREDTLEFMRSLESKAEDSPCFLFDKLRNSNLLIVGCRFAEWLARLFAEDSIGKRHIVSQVDVDASAELGDDGYPVIFLQRFNGGARVLRSRGGADFVDELYRRWSELRPAEEPETPAGVSPLSFSPGMQPGAVFLSYVREDEAAAKSIRDALDGAGVDVILHADDAPLAEKWEKKLRSFLDECSLFMPVISARSLAAARRFFRPEWVEAIVEASKAVPSGRFVLPVVIDEISPETTPMPQELGELQWERLPGGRAGSRFVEVVVGLQRSYRRASLA